MTAAKKLTWENFDKGHLKGIRASILAPKQEFVLCLEPLGDPKNLAAWAEHNRADLASAFLRYGAILFRGFKPTPLEFKGFCDSLFPSQKNLEYAGGVSSRHKYGEAELYLSTTFPKEGRMPQHHEMSYLPRSPRYIAFYCDVAAETGGETPICSVRQFMKELDPAIVKLLKKEGVLYVRNYRGDILGPSWQQSLQTDSREKAEEFCRQNGFEFEWREGNRLRTSNRGLGVITHPDTGEELYHNHSYVLNLSTKKNNSVMSPSLRLHAPGLPEGGVDLVRSSDPRDLPFNTFLGNGKPMDHGILEEIHQVYESESIAFQWQKGDFVVLDNVLASHARNAFTGDRRILTVIK